MNTTDKDREEAPISAQNVVLKLRLGRAITDEDDIPDYLFLMTTGQALAFVQKYCSEAKAEALREATDRVHGERLRKGYEKSDFNVGFQHGIDTAIDAILADEPTTPEKAQKDIDYQSYALKQAAERADEALVEWFDPFRMYDVEKDLGEVRAKVLYAITHAAGQKKDTCSWRFDGDLWASECGLCWEFPERGPAENSVVYCPRCGKLVRDETKEGE